MRRPRGAPPDQGPPTFYSALTERAILPLFDMLSGSKVLPMYREKLEQQWLTRAELEELQARRIAAMLQHGWDNVPFYRARFEKAGLKRPDLDQPGALAEIPVLEKREVISDYEQMVDRSQERKLYWTTTGGSTGETVRLCFDTEAFNSIKAREMRSHAWMGIHQGERVGRLWGSPIEVRHAHTLKSRVISRLKNVLFLDGYHMTEQAMADYAAALRSFRPRLFITFTSCLNVFAEFLDARGIHDIRPQAITTTASPLYPKYRALFERIFGCPVYDVYGSRELGGAAHECPAHEGLHLSMEDLHISVEEDGRPVSDGQEGELVATCLYNRAFPLIRYAMKDRGRYLTEDCPCGIGLRRIEIARGRASEVLMGPLGVPVMGEFFIDVFDALPGEVLRFRIYQETPTKLAMHLVAPQPLADKSREYVLRSVAGKFGEEMEVEFVYRDELPPLPSGKHLLTINRSGKSRES